MKNREGKKNSYFDAETEMSQGRARARLTTRNKTAGIILATAIGVAIVVFALRVLIDPLISAVLRDPADIVKSRAVSVQSRVNKDDPANEAVSVNRNPVPP